MTKKETAKMCFSKGFNCAQAIFSIYAPELGFDEENALRIACGFGAGMGRRQEVCGAVTGAFMLIGYKYGNVEPEDGAAKEKTYRTVSEFAECFTRKNGSIICRELLGCDIRTEQGLSFARENNLFEKKCAKYVYDSASIVEEVLL